MPTKQATEDNRVQPVKPPRPSKLSKLSMQTQHYILQRDYPGPQDEWRALQSPKRCKQAQELCQQLSEWQQRLQGLGLWQKFRQQMLRRIAIETGQIEGLYQLNLGVTQTLIESGLQASLISHQDAAGQDPELIIAQVQDQQDVIEGLFAFVKQEQGLTHSYIRGLHQKLCRHQDTTWAVDSQGKRAQVPLRKGAYKDRPNNPQREDGGVFHYCPADQVQAEMETLLGLFAEIYVEKQDKSETLAYAVWLHHRFTLIHPFQDGNGRLARVLASIVLLRHDFYPLLVEREQHSNYIQALEAADSGALVPLWEFFYQAQRAYLDLGFAILGEQYQPYTQPEAYSRLIAALKQGDKQGQFSKEQLSQAYNSRGNRYQRQGKRLEALEDYNKAIALQSDYAEAYNNRGNVYQQLGKWSESLQDYHKVIALQSNNTAAYYNRGRLYQQQGKWQEALKDYQEAIRLQPDCADVYNNRGLLLVEQGKWQEALQDYKEAIRLQPKFIAAYENRANLYRDQGKWQEALDNYHKAIELEPNYAAAYNNRGILFTMQGKWQEALKDYKEVTRLQPNFTLAYVNRANLYQEQGQYQKALNDCNKALQLLPNFAPLLAQRQQLLALLQPESFAPVKLRSLRLRSFLHLGPLDLEFGPLNLFIGKNGTGKTSLLKLLYALLQGRWATQREGAGKPDALRIHLQRHLPVFQSAQGYCIEVEIQDYQSQSHYRITGTEVQVPQHLQTVQASGVYIPAREVLSQWKLILGQKDEGLAPEPVSSDLARLFVRESLAAKAQHNSLLDCFQHYKGRESVEQHPTPSGLLEYRYRTATGQYIDLNQGAEGTRRLQQLRLLLENGSITKDSVLLIDEPENNLHPAYIRQFVQILAALAAKGVQVFLASHSYFVLKQLAAASKRFEQKALCLALLADDQNKIYCHSHELHRGIPNNEILEETLDMNDEYDAEMLGG